MKTNECLPCSYGDNKVYTHTHTHTHTHVYHISNEERKLLVQLMLQAWTHEISNILYITMNNKGNY